MEYGLPVQVRDSILKVKDDLPRSDVNREFYLQNMDRQIAESDGTGKCFVLIPKLNLMPSCRVVQVYLKISRLVLT